jgi:hypothetical protein
MVNSAFKTLARARIFKCSKSDLSVFISYNDAIKTEAGIRAFYNMVNANTYT